MKKTAVDLLITGAKEVLTCKQAGRDLIGRRQGVAIAIAGEKIMAVAPLEEIKKQFETGSAKIIDAAGKIVAPGFVDCHTHLVFGGSRVQEYAAKMTMSAAEVKKLGIPTGIRATMQMTRGETVEQLTAGAADRLQQMFFSGTTTVESKSGYGLSLSEEIKMLEVNRRLQTSQSVDIVSTLLAAHDFPPELSREKYVDLIVNEIIPRVAHEKLAVFNDVYCDKDYYSAKQSHRILSAGQKAGLKPKIHLDGYANIGGTKVAIEVGAVSADHLNYTTRSEMRRLAKANIVGVVMPALDFAVGHKRPFDARAIMEEGMTLALASDLCPGCWTESMQVVMQLACRLYRFSPAEAFYAATIGAARALQLESDRGSLEPGKLADIQIWNIPTFEDVVYRIGHNAVEIIIKRGKVYRKDKF